MKILILIAALFALQPAFAAVDLQSHGDSMKDCDKTKGTRHGDCPR